VGEHVVLKKKGKEFVGICPFHDDKSPSMTVSPAKQFYYCFSCGAGGNSLKFLMELKRQSFSDVVLELARKYSLPVETLDAPQQERLKEQLTRRDKIHRALALASGWFRANLRSPIGAAALNYLQKDRGLNNGTIELFELGYAPDKWDALIGHLQQVENIDINCLEMAGLVVARKGGDGFYDRFRERLMVPIHDRQGRIIGFGGRSLEGVEPKYLNSPETEVFEKGKHLFGLDKAADPIRRADCAIVVEGYFDVIALHAAGVRHSVAALGTALGSQQINQLCRCCDSRRIVLNFDADGAGIRAAQRAIGEVEQQALQGQIELRILPLPEGKDPDDFLKLQGPANYLALVEQAPLWLDWQIEQVLLGMDLNRADQFQQVVKALVELLGKLPQSALRSHYLQRVAERLSGGQSRMALQLEEDL
ncbi:MAG: DNA primase, partial [Synechococcaceae bacterium WB6_3A_227]|nr:DNA primase [Synechococcaceae bacterium WB6_3A_227]